MALITAVVVTDPAVARRVADALTAELRRTGSHDTDLAALVVDLTALALPPDADHGNRRVTPEPCAWLTTAEYAKGAGITPRAARARAQTGAVAARKDHGRWLIGQA